MTRSFAGSYTVNHVQSYIVEICIRGRKESAYKSCLHSVQLKKTLVALDNRIKYINY